MHNSSRKKIDSLTGLRGIAALIVLIAHNLVAFPYLAQLSTRLAFLSMSLFFVLSGFIIYYNYAASLRSVEGIYRFIVARFARLYPLYAIMTLIYFFLTKNVTFAMIISHIILIQSWFYTPLIFGPAWSISTEWFFYLFFVAGVTFFISITHPKRAILVFFAVVPLILMLTFFYRNLISAIYWYPWLTYYSPYVRLSEFIAGIFAAKIFLDEKRKSPSILAIAGVLWCTIILAMGGNLEGTIFSNFTQNFIFAPALVVIILYSCDKNWFSNILSCPLAMLTGEISYSLYMLQSCIYRLLSNYVTASPVKLMALVIPLTYFLAIITYYYFERPSRILINGLLNRTIPLEVVAVFDKKFGNRPGFYTKAE